MARSSLALGALAAAAALSACATAPGRTIVIPAGRDVAYDRYHYAPAVRVGDTVIVSGIPAGLGDTYEAKVTAMFEELERVLAAAGASLADVVEITTFHADVTDTASFEAEFVRFQAIHERFFRDGYPAWTAVGTTALLDERAPVEMRAVAVVGAGRRTRIERNR
jgi:enamine deaminase RidA (YjgF/YER057c/UK114 family)